MRFSSLITLTGPINRMQTVNLLNIYLPQIILYYLGPNKYHNKTCLLYSMHSGDIPCFKIKIWLYVIMHGQAFTLLLKCDRLLFLLNTCMCLSQFITHCKWFTKLLSILKILWRNWLTNHKPRCFYVMVKKIYFCFKNEATELPKYGKMVPCLH